MIDQEKFHTALSQGKMDEIRKMTQEALDAGESAEMILKGGLIQAMDRVGMRFKKGEVYIPEVLIAARAMHAGMAILKPILSKSTSVMGGKVIIGTVKGDLHDIGKNLVVMMLEGGGFEVIDLGIDIPSNKFVEAIRQHQPQVVAMSALLTTTMKEIQSAIQVIDQAGLRKQVKTIVGGAPVTEKFAREIGADGYAPDAASAVDLVKSLIAGK
ncbi:MAG: cobalamin-binding protein [Deltaproteobacteria bacterium]|nr:cobalamin-binding protein [Deltaproteobacteria bacterium]